MHSMQLSKRSVETSPAAFAGCFRQSHWVPRLPCALLPWGQAPTAEAAAGGRALRAARARLTRVPAACWQAMHSVL
jgi:hypothetical protein